MMYVSQNHAPQRSHVEHLPGGAVFEDLSFGFMPAFKNVNNQEVHLCTYEDGALSVVHVLDGLPWHWVQEWGDDRRPVSLIPGIIAGFMRFGRFYTLHEISNRICDS